MKRIKIIFLSIILTIAVNLLIPTISFAESSHFESFTADYYLSKNEQKGSELKVVEEITAVFPDFDEHKGIYRYIPYTNMNKTNITMDNPDSIKVYRNGEEENIYSLEREDGFYVVSTGTDDYIHGRQIFRFEYTFNNVVTEFEKNDRSWQELYWDTVGTGWNYSFQSVSVRVHLPEDLKVVDGTSCYVGPHGSNDSSRCNLYDIGNTYYFNSKNTVQPGENLTFAIPFEDGQFIIPEQPRSIFSIPAIILAGLGSLFSIFLYGKNRKRTNEKYHYYRDRAEVVEYTPPQNLTVGEMALNYKNTLTNPQVATLLELAVTHKIEIIKEEKKKAFIFSYQPWSIKILSTDLTKDQRDALHNITGETDFEKGSTYEIKSNQTTSSRNFDNHIESSLREKGLLEDKSSKNTSLINLFLIFWIVIAGIITIFSLVSSNPILYTSNKSFVVPLVISIIIAIVILVLYNTKVAFYDKHTKAGLDKIRYMDGLKTYIKMAEKDRLAFLQSVDGADTTANGIVKLYEKLLPYAVLFGMEKSWLKTLGQYYEQEGVSSPIWYSGVGGFDSSDFANSISSFSSSASSSSGDSGSSGGGYSGGGGGGGGGGFR
ncbi:DUF2207 domain-containing protein [Candidatus Saccharibacteria bacterium]|nr:DUF2207 domain-containing protein [Candidatus Saccharibacteria bacterium]